MLAAGRIPDSHTRFSWSPASSDVPVPIGHTCFSWGIDAATSYPEATGNFYANANVSPEVQKAAVKRGFLNKGTQLKDVDPHHLLAERVPIVLARAAELHLVEDEEKSPFKSKYEAREMLKGVMAQLSSCEDRLEASDPNLRELWSESVARVDLMLGTNFVETEELSQGEKHLTSALDRMTPRPSRFACEVTILHP